jgi:cytochrome c biogenesis protein CcdA
MRYQSTYQLIKPTSLFLIALCIACSWLILPYFIQGSNLLNNASNQTRLIKADTVASYLSRDIIRTNVLEITGTFATTEYFQYVDRALTISNLRPDQNFIFFINETVHTDDLPVGIPQVVLKINDLEFYPNVSLGPPEASHHRLNTYSFSKFNTEGQPIVLNEDDIVQLFVTNRYLGSDIPMTFIGRWEGGFELPEELKSRSDMTFIIMLALGAGLLSTVLTPCLLQLVIMFGGIMGGLSNSPATNGNQQDHSLVKQKIKIIAAGFILGFLALYVIAGVVIGFAGNQAQLMFAVYSRNVSIISGIVVILMGTWMLARGNKINACPIMSAKDVSSMNNKDIIATVVGSIGFALGCTACFGGAIVGTLVVYVGAIGSPLIGGSIMFIFGLGVAIPFFLSAIFLTKSKTILELLGTYRRSINIASSMIVILFGLVLVSDNFHTVSDFIYPYLGLS